MGEIATTYKWQRPVIGILALAGIADSAYLLWAHQAGKSVACPKGIFQCDAVLLSSYASVEGLPLAAAGLIAYLTVGLLALASWLANRDSWDRLTLASLRALTVAMAASSAFLLYVMVGVLHALCLYCLVSVGLSLALMAVAQLSRTGSFFHPRPLVAGLAVAAAGIATVAMATPPPTPQEVRDADGRIILQLAFGPNVPTTTWSGPAEMALAKHLNLMGSIMFGGYKCPHCHRQKQLFGKEAMKLIRYVECDQGSAEFDREACDAAHVESFPTWVIGHPAEYNPGDNPDLQHIPRPATSPTPGLPILSIPQDAIELEKVDGELDLEELAEYSRYPGARAFLRKLPVDPDANKLEEDEPLLVEPPTLPN